MTTDFLRLADACRAAAAGRVDDVSVETLNEFLTEFYTRGQTFVLFQEALEPLADLLAEVNALEPKTVLQAVAQTLRQRQRQPDPVNLAFRRFATVLELAHQLQEIYNDEPDVPEVQAAGSTEECPNRGLPATDETDVFLPDVRSDGTDGNDSADLHDS